MVTGPRPRSSGRRVFTSATYAPATGANAVLVRRHRVHLGHGLHARLGLERQQAGDPAEPAELRRSVEDDPTLSSQVVQKIAAGEAAIIPGITITSTATCAVTAALPDPATGGTMLGMSNVSPASYQVSALQGTSGATQGNNAAVSQVNFAMSVHTCDNWSTRGRPNRGVRSEDGDE